MHAPTLAARMRAIRAIGSLVARLATEHIEHSDGGLIIADLQAVLDALNIRTISTAENSGRAAKRVWPAATA